MAGGGKVGGQLVELCDKAIKAAARAEEGEENTVDEARCVDALKAMRKTAVTTTILMDTQVGKRLRKLNKHKNSKICAAAQDLIDDWKRIVTAEAAAKSPSPALPSKTESLKSPKVEKIVKTERMEVKTTVTTTHHPGPETPKVGSVAKSGDDARDKIRELLLGAFSKVLTEAEGEDLQRATASSPGQVAVAVETAMFRKLGPSTRGTGKVKYRSVMFNLKDANNPDLRRRVVTGAITPEELLTMSAEDMASDQRKRENQNIKDKALFECERGLKNAASTDQFKCGKCKQRKCTYFQMQTRSADEPMTTYVTCVNCDNHWKFC